MMNDATYGSYLFDEDGFAAAVEECAMQMRSFGTQTIFA